MNNDHVYCVINFVEDMAYIVGESRLEAFTACINTKYYKVTDDYNEALRFIDGIKFSDSSRYNYLKDEIDSAFDTICKMNENAERPDLDRNDREEIKAQVTQLKTLLDDLSYKCSGFVNRNKDSYVEKVMQDTGDYVDEIIEQFDKFGKFDDVLKL